jgi:hypothetical protein
MCATTRLSAADLQRQCRPETIRVERPGAETLQPAAACQERALEALRFGPGIRRPGYP